MLSYIIRRLLVCIPTVFLVITLVFFAFQLIPGDAALIFAGEQASQEQIAQIRSDLGLDKPVFEQYSIYLQRLLKGDMGKSAITGRPVFLEIKSRFFNTVRLAVVATVVSSIFGIVFGPFPH